MEQKPTYLTAKGWLTEDEREYLKTAAATVSPIGIIVEIGGEFGASTVCLREGNKDAIIVTIDLFPNDLIFHHLHEITKAGVTDTIQFRGHSHTIGQLWCRPIDFLLVDGGHTYDIVKGDIRFWIPKVKPSGIVAFHDYYGTHLLHAEVREAVDEWVETHTPDTWTEMPSVDSIQPFRRLE